MSYLTVLTSENRCNKLVSLSPSGDVIKKAGNIAWQRVAQAMTSPETQTNYLLIRSKTADEKGL